MQLETRRPEPPAPLVATKRRLTFLVPLSKVKEGRSRKNECPQCNATFVALTQFTIIRESWYSI